MVFISSSLFPRLHLPLYLLVCLFIQVGMRKKTISFLKKKNCDSYIFQKCIFKCVVDNVSEISLKLYWFRKVVYYQIYSGTCNEFLMYQMFFWRLILCVECSISTFLWEFEEEEVKLLNSFLEVKFLSYKSKPNYCLNTKCTEQTRHFYEYSNLWKTK